MKINYNKNPTILNDFLYYLRDVKGYAEETLKAYNSDLLQLFHFIKKYNEIKIDIKNFNIFIVLQVKEHHIIAFLVYLNFNKNNSPYTRQRKLSSIRTFYKWLLSNHPNIAKENPSKEIANIRKLVKLPKYLTLEQAKKIQEIFTLENTKFPIRNNTIISLFLNTGIRASELININLKDVNWEDSSIKICGKGNKERMVYFSTSCKTQLLKYLHIRNRNKKIIDIDEPLFISYQNKRLGIDGVEYVCKKAYELMGLKEFNYVSHTLRHTASSILYTYAKQDILLLKNFLGHSHITTTQIYTHIYNSKVKDAIDRHPLNKEKIS